MKRVCIKHRFWCIYNEEEDKLVLAFPSRISATLAVANMVMKDHEEHFIMWCDLRGLEHNQQSWIAYGKDVISSEEKKYSIEKVWLSKSDLAKLISVAISRMENVKRGTRK